VRPLSRLGLVDIAIAVGAALVQVGGTVLASHGQQDVRPLDALGYLLLGSAAAAVLVRRRWPVAVLTATFTATFAYALSGYPGGPVWAALIVALVTTVISGHRVVAYGCLAVGYLAFLWIVPLLIGRPLPSVATAVGVAAWMLFLPAVTEVVRNRRAYAQANRQRVLEEARSEREVARRQASDERLGIARELHDVLAHSLSLINVQAGVALELEQSEPEQVRAALSAIKRTSRDALIDVQAVLASLRRPDEAAPLSPAATVRNLEELVRRARTTGLAVEVTVTGALLELPRGIDAAGYRIVQEALTNVVRHAHARHVAIRLGVHGSELMITVDDDGDGDTGGEVNPQRHRHGEGIPGMRERAAALGGHLEAGPRTHGGFRVQARLPLPPASDRAAP
jgi:signal transduction histidine kinase